MNTTRYSREDFADAMHAALNYAGSWEVCLDVPPSVAVPTSLLRLWAAQFSEAANRAPTHAELVKQIDGQPPRAERRVQAAERLCQIYWDIAVEAVGEDEARRRRDEEIARIIGTGAPA